MVLPWGRPSRRWRSLSTRSTCAPSVARTRWRGRPPAFGSATTRTAESRWLEVPTLTPPPPRPPSGRWKKNGKYFSKQQQHSVFPLNVGESNFSCCEIAWFSIHRIYIVCVRIIKDHTMTADRVLDSLLHTRIITTSPSGLLWGGWGRWRRPKCSVHRPSFVPLKAARTVQNCDLHCFWACLALFLFGRWIWHQICGCFRSSGSALVTHWPVTNSTKIMAAYKVTRTRYYTLWWIKFRANPMNSDYCWILII